ncbi:anaerobic ribonucleoside-triphosphate reductase [bacterium]|nr:anaerobic ribonucleoside-triphosphate reductase [bacterium]
MANTRALTSVRKRDGRIVLFDKNKIMQAILKAAAAVGGQDKTVAEELTNAITSYLEQNFRNNVPEIEEIQDIVEKVLIETGHAKTSKAYILYRNERARLREMLQVRKEKKVKATTTDLSLFVSTVTHDEILPWNKAKISMALVKEAGVSQSVADTIATSVEENIFTSGLTQISTSLIRELVDNELFINGYKQKLSKQQVLGMPIFDIEQLIFSKSNENSNIAANNPEAINLTIAEGTLKQYALRKIFSSDISEAHLKGIIHLHDLGYPTRVYCSSHSLEYLKKYGLELVNLDTSSAPASHARTLTGHLNTFLASMQAYYAGALGVGYINIFYAPYVVGMSEKEMRQEAQYLIFSSSQNAFSRGGQTLFLDFNIHTGIPGYLKNIKAIGPSGEYTGKTYAEYEPWAQKFAKAMMDVWRAGDKNGNIFAFPKMDLHISEETFNDPNQLELFKYACKIASENGTPYFVFDRDEVTLSACCRLRTQIKDDYMIKHPESMRFCGFQNVTINLPQAAYRAGRGNIDGIYKEIEHAMDLAMTAHIQKKKFIASLMKDKTMPLWQIGKKAKDGRRYVDLDEATYIIGIIGLNECVQYLTGKELHEDDQTYRLGLKIISFMNLTTKKYEQKHGLRVALEESPAESAARRLAKVDMREYPESKDIVKGDMAQDEYYYTNSIHFRADAPIGLVERIEKQAKFHTMIESGAILHAFIGEAKPSPESIFNLVKKTFYNTKAAQLTISPEFTICNSCSKTTRGLVDVCGNCNSEDVYGITRIVGYFSRVNNWNKSKLGELRDRQKGEYKIA